MGGVIHHTNSSLFNTKIKMKNIKNVLSIDLKAIPIKIYETDVFLSKSELNIIKKISSLKEDKKIKQKVALSQKTNILKEKKLERLNNLFEQVSNHYSGEVLKLKNKFVMVKSWAALAKKNQFHHMHNHPNIVYSLVYYVTDNNSGLFIDIKKSSIQENFNFEYSVKEYNIYNSRAWTVNPKKGNIVVFPGDLLHGTLPQKNDSERIIVGANYFIDGHIGEPDIYSSFNIDVK